MKHISKVSQYLKNNRNLSIGILFIAIGLILPSFLTVNSLGIYNDILLSLQEENTGLLIVAAFKLCVLNSIRALPLYVGAFYVTNSVSLFRKHPFFHFSFVFFILTLSYLSIRLIYGIHYDFSYPAIVMIIVIYLLEKREMHNVRIIKKITVMILILISVQFLDTVPALSVLGFGRGEISSDIKNISNIIDPYHTLTIFSLVFFIIFLCAAFLVLKILIDQNELLHQSNKRRIAEIALSNSKLRLLESRTTVEIQNLVHDLKTPLTSIQGLSNVIELTAKNPSIIQYSRNISQSSDIMNEMISEILYEDKKSLLSINDLVNFIFSHIRDSELSRFITISNPLKNETIRVNKIRFFRAIVNIIQNAYTYIDKENGHIDIAFEKKNDTIYITITDNGKGISDNELAHIWEIGYSKSGSTGLGLNFVKEVIENHQGTIHITSMINQGTKVTIKIKEAFN